MLHFLHWRKCQDNIEIKSPPVLYSTSLRRLSIFFGNRLLLWTQPLTMPGIPHASYPCRTARKQASRRRGKSGSKSYYTPSQVSADRYPLRAAVRNGAGRLPNRSFPLNILFHNTPVCACQSVRSIVRIICTASPGCRA